MKPNQHQRCAHSKSIQCINQFFRSAFSRPFSDWGRAPEFSAKVTAWRKNFRDRVRLARLTRTSNSGQLFRLFDLSLRDELKLEDLKPLNWEIVKPALESNNPPLEVSAASDPAQVGILVKAVEKRLTPLKQLAIYGSATSEEEVDTLKDFLFTVRVRRAYVENGEVGFLRSACRGY